jgi:hypothetical protein
MKKQPRIILNKDFHQELHKTEPVRFYKKIIREHKNGK